MRVATRASPLALLQAREITSLLSTTVEEVVVETRGDKSADTPITEMGGQGVFVKEIQIAVLEGRADFAVHSAKDLPPVPPPGLMIAAIPPRGDARDALVGSSLAELPDGGRVATGSVRRRAQLSILRPDLQFFELRGNIDTRLAKAKNFDAIVVAAAALHRLGYDDKIAEVLHPELLVPQVGQGALAVECRSDDTALIELLQGIEDADSRRAVDAERAFLAQLGSGCNLPVGGYAQVNDDVIRLDAIVVQGSDAHRHTAVGDDAASVGREAAENLLKHIDPALL